MKCQGKSEQYANLLKQFTCYSYATPFLHRLTKTAFISANRSEMPR